ncbi:glycosyltransferase family 4 protein [Luedemannella flava]|uniref:Glycosyltransferase family 4 protein n=1 Tax=Luedemannella flava TaxID=349316 RepID=A0ABP4XN24_9ACTN
MKVVIAHNRYREALPSGENVIVDAEISQLRAAGVEVLPFQRASDGIGALPLLDKALLPLSPLYNRRAQADLADLIRRERPDLLHLHNPYPLLSPWVIRTAHAHGVPVIQTVHNYRQVCASGLYFRDGHICTDCKGRAFGLPAVIHSCYRGSKAQSAAMATALAAHRGTWRSVDRYIALTSAIKDHLIEYGIPEANISVKPNAIPDPGPAPTTAGEGFLYAARLSPEKGLGLLLDAWRRHPDGALGQLRIAGDGELRPLAEAAAAERSDVTYLGVVPREEMSAQLRSAAVFLAVPTWHDVLPTAIIEALANGRPVLGTDVGGVPFLVGADQRRFPEGSRAGLCFPGVGGWVVAPEAGALAEGFAVARTQAGSFGDAARKRYLEMFHPEVVTGRLLEIYREVSAARPAGRRAR